MGADLWVRRTDANNGYRIRVTSTFVTLYNLEEGNLSWLTLGSFYEDETVAVKIKVNGTSIKVWINGTSEIDTTDSTHGSGGVALTGAWTIFDNLKVGYDNNSDDDIDDAGDNVVIDEDFSSTSFTVSYDP